MKNPRLLNKMNYFSTLLCVTIFFNYILTSNAQDYSAQLNFQAFRPNRVDQFDAPHNTQQHNSNQQYSNINNNTNIQPVNNQIPPTNNQALPQNVVNQTVGNRNPLAYNNQQTQYAPDQNTYVNPPLYLTQPQYQQTYTEPQPNNWHSGYPAYQNYQEQQSFANPLAAAQTNIPEYVQNGTYVALTDPGFGGDQNGLPIPNPPPVYPNGFTQYPNGTLSTPQYMPPQVSAQPFSQAYSKPEQPIISRNFTQAQQVRRPITTCDYLTFPLKAELNKYKTGTIRFYQWDTALNFSLALGCGAVLANTSIDDNFNDWYQDDIRNSGTDNTAKFFKTFGEGKYMIPSVIALGFAYRYMQIDYNMSGKHVSSIGEWGSRSGRAYWVGFPALLLGQIVLGASRPGENPWGSQWRPFKDNNAISGHAFIGAVPFITAAQMTNKIWLKSILYLGSTMTAWSRVNDEAHYLSQVILGWYLAYLSVRAITLTEDPKYGRGLTVFPITETNMLGIGVLYTR
ncbi:MAG: phosphatase PAP2 family protein [Thermoguttaceae bacterium]